MKKFIYFTACVMLILSASSDSFGQKKAKKGLFKNIVRRDELIDSLKAATELPVKKFSREFKKLQAEVEDNAEIANKQNSYRITDINTLGQAISDIRNDTTIKASSVRLDLLENVSTIMQNRIDSLKKVRGPKGLTDMDLMLMRSSILKEVNGKLGSYFKKEFSWQSIEGIKEDLITHMRKEMRDSLRKRDRKLRTLSESSSSIDSKLDKSTFFWLIFILFDTMVGLHLYNGYRIRKLDKIVFKKDDGGADEHKAPNLD